MRLEEIKTKARRANIVAWLVEIETELDRRNNSLINRRNYSLVGNGDLTEQQNQLIAELAAMDAAGAEEESSHAI